VRVGQGKGNWKDKRGEERERCEQENERKDGGEEREWREEEDKEGKEGEGEMKSRPMVISKSWHL